MTELWQQAAEWLRTCIQLDSNLKFQRVEDFVAFLKDGVVLCAAANQLSNGCVTQFIADSNLTLFLNACRDTFGIAEHDLFQIEDLSDLEDFAKVLRLLSLLSRTHQAELLGLTPFPRGISRRTSHFSLELPDEEVEIYTELRTSDEPSVDEVPQSTSFDIYGKQHEEEIYNSLIYHRAGPTEQLNKYAEFKPRDKRQYGLKELLDTETNYCATLKTIVDHFYRPMGVVLGTTDHKVIFQNIYELYRVHQQFLEKLRRSVLVALDLEKADDSGAHLSVPEVFMTFKFEFLKYTDYCSFLDQSREKIAEIEQTQPQIAKQLEVIIYWVVDKTAMPLDDPPRRRTTKSRLSRPILGLQQYRSLDVAESEIFAKFIPSRPPVDKVPELTENYYTSRVFGVDESVVNHYTLEPTVLEEKSKKTESNLVLLPKDYRSKCGQEHVKLSDMLTVPMQRILKYHLLLNQLLENTPVGDEEVELLDRAYECMKDVSDYVNEGKRDNEIKAVVREIQGKVINSEQDPDCEYYGRLQQDGSCKVMDTTLGNQQKKRYVFLFDKVLMICKSNYGQTGEMKKTYPVSSLQIVETERETQLSRSTSTLTRKLTNSLFDYISLTVRVQDCSGQPQSYLHFVFQRMSQRDLWRKAIEGAIDRCNPVAARRHRHDVVYSSYQIPTHCDVCHKLLLGLFYQGYHCRLCKKNIHYKCLGLGNTLCPQRPSGLLNRSNSNGTTHILLNPHRFDVGERVRALQSVNSPDGAVLNFQQGDMIEITRENDDGTLTGRLLGTPSRIGVFSREIVERVPRSFSSASTSCLTFNGSAADRLSGMTEVAERRPNLVTSARITLFEQRNAPLEDQPWFFGELERQQVKMFLELTEDGTFLVRRSSNLGQYVLSIMYDGNEKHMKIEMDPENRLFYLHAARYFHDIPSLIEHYRRHSLSEGFENLCTTLKGTPLRQKNFRAEYPFVDIPNDSSRFLRLEADTQVRVLDTSEEEKGWWMGISRGVTGYFPYAFVEEDNVRYNSEDSIA
ncbi:hypothetical protein M3Y98_01156500 [Aphelenchoides besseyi]|nr:hypothetical protein M3Y98_01156500 [Aphelenchoides besseyi]KAI6210832.1 hypothetical protein M3Y96_00369800 [Aphelenchoides besseyi]